MKHTLGTGAKATGKSRTAILRSIQKGRLSATKDGDDREDVMLGIIEQRICERYPIPIPLTGQDIIKLGVPPSSLIMS